MHPYCSVWHYRTPGPTVREEGRKYWENISRTIWELLSSGKQTGKRLIFHFGSQWSQSCGRVYVSAGHTYSYPNKHFTWGLAVTGWPVVRHIDDIEWCNEHCTLCLSVSEWICVILETLHPFRRSPEPLEVWLYLMKGTLWLDLELRFCLVVHERSLLFDFIPVKVLCSIKSENARDIF